MQASEQDSMLSSPPSLACDTGGYANTRKVRFNVLRVLPRTGKTVKQFNKF